MPESVYLHPPAYLDSFRDLPFLQRTMYSTVDWCAATTALTITPPDDKKFLITRIGIAAYNPAADFGATLTAKKYSDETPYTFIEADGYAPLINTCDDIKDFKIGANDMIVVKWRFRNGILLDSARKEYAEFTTSALITGTDQFYVGVSIIEF